MNAHSTIQAAEPSQTAVNTITGRDLLRFALVILLVPVMLFVAAGRLDWPMAWAYSFILVAVTVISRLIVFRRNPSLLSERAHAAGFANVKDWDRRLSPLMGLLFPLLMILVIGLDKRAGWSPELPGWVQGIALALVVAGYAFSSWALVVNRFFSGYVRIQTERGHSVISSGPYRLVRHPGYAGGLLALAAMPFMLGSLWALIPMLITAVLYVVRTALEDRTLQAELPGYAAYAQRVRFRLLPGIW